MLKMGLTSEEQLAHLTQTIARRILLSSRKVLPFSDIQEFLPHLLAETAERTDHLVAAGHISPDVVIAADRTELKVSETVDVSPFTAGVDAALSKIVTGSELIYAANPNRVTGANFGLADLETLVQAVPEGFLLVDEYYFDYFGITGLPLLEQYSNVCVLRSFAAAFGVESSDSGYIAGPSNLIDRMRGRISNQIITTTIYRTAITSLENDAALDLRLKTLHDEAMRLSTELTGRGLQNRITAADFLLLRVKDPTVVGNHLTRYKVLVENLDGYPLLKGYLRYKIQSPLSNDRLLNAISRIPAEQYRLTTIDKRVVTLRRPAEASQSEQPAVINRKPVKLTRATEEAEAEIQTNSTRIRH